MSNDVVVVVESDGSGFTTQSFSAVTAAQQLAAALGGDVTAVILSSDGTRLSAVDVDWDVAEIILVENSGERIDGLLGQSLVGEIVAARSPGLVLMPHAGPALEIAAGLAASGGYGFGADLSWIGYGDNLSGTRYRYGGKVIETLEFELGRTNVLTIRDGAYEPRPWTTEAGRTEITRFSVRSPLSTTRVRVVAPDSSGVDITQADFVLAVGRGIGGQDNVQRFAALANRLGATFAASRPLVDVGWVPPERQVGQSGKTVKPKIYLALGISGSIQHVAGMRASQNIIAVNSDASAPIFEIAHYGAVMDVLELADALETVFTSN